MGHVSWAMVLAVLGASVSLCGCRTAAKPSGFLKDYSNMAPGPGGADLAYRNPNAQWQTYDKVIVEPVVWWVKGEGQISETEVTKELAGHFRSALESALRQGGYTLVNAPGLGTLRIRPAITDVQKGLPVMHAVTSLMPIGLVASTAKAAVTGKPMGVGEATVEIEITDAQTGERLFAAVDRQVGRKYQFTAGLSTWGHVDAAFGSWAERLGEGLAAAKGGGK